MRIIIQPHILFVWLLAAVFSADALGAGLSARLDRTRITEGETVLLTLEAPGDATGTPDLSPLARDFDILKQAQSTRMSFVNGQGASSREWQLVLAPKRTGKLQVPAIALGGASSAPASLEVLPAAQAAKLGSPQPVLLEVEAGPERPYVQQKVIVTVRLLSRAALRQASLSDPHAADAIIERLGEDKESTTYRDGQQYRVIERRYAVFPQHSGSLEIESPVLSAQVPESGQRGRGVRDRFFGRDPFGDFGRIFGRDPFADLGGVFEQTRPIQVRGKNLSLDVRAQPAGSPSPWLPAESVVLNEAWSTDPPVFRVGEPVTRTIAITAQGVTGAQLPDLAPEAPAGVKVYPDQPQVETRAEGDTLVALKVLKSALVPARAGSVTLPGVELAWWDAKAGLARVASLPAREVTVLPAAPGTAPAAPPAQTGAPLQAPERPSAAAGVTPRSAGGTGAAAPGNGPPGRPVPSAGYWPWIAAALGLAWLVSTGLWLRARGRHGARPAAAEGPSPQPAPSPAKALARVEQACRDADARAARQALLEWAAASWPQDPPGRLEDLARRLGGEAAAVLRELDRGLYGGGGQGWEGDAAWRGLAPSLSGPARPGEAGPDSAPLPPLYPQGV